jgi:DNA polymerase III subunit gamma/tau
VTQPGLALRYRPQNLRDLAGQRAVSMVLFRMLHEGSREAGWAPRKVPRVPQALLFTGTRGSGKTSTARILGKALNCDSEGERPCGSCASCEAITEGTSLAVVEIDAASNGTVDQVHRLQELVSYEVASPYRVVILDEVHGMSPAGTEALLKLLEEPPRRTVFALLTTERGKVKDTIFSRCSAGLFTFRRITPADITARLVHICRCEGITAEDALLAALADQADGSLRDAVMLLDQVSSAGVTTRAAFERLHGESDFAPWLLAYMVTGDYPALFSGVDRVLSEVGDYRLITAKLVACLRDVLVLQAGAEVTAQGAGLRYRQQLASAVTAPQVVRVMRVLWDLRTKLRAEDPRSSLELAMVMGAEIIHPAQEARATSAPSHSNGGNGHAPATISQLKALVTQ